jgi:hypothetical protein
MGGYVREMVAKFKLVACLLATEALWVGIQTSLKNSKWAKAKERRKKINKKYSDT